MEAEKVEPLGTSSEVHDPGLLRVQSQPDRIQDRCDQLAGLFGLIAGRAQGDEIICVLHRHPQPSRIAVTGHRDGAVFDRAVAELLEELHVAPELVPGPPALALPAAVAEGALVAVATMPDALLPGVIVRRLEPHRSLPF